MKSTIKRITLPAVAVIVCVLSLLMYVNAQAANFADYLPLNTSTRILVTTKGNPGDIGRTYVNRVTGTEQIGTTLTTKIGVIPYAPDAYNSFYNITNDGTTVKWWGNQFVTFDPPFSIGIINDGDLTPIFSSNITDRCTQAVSYGEAADSVLIDIRDVTVSGVTYPNAIVEFFIDPDLSAREVNFGANTLGFPSTYLPNSRSPLPGAITGFDIFASGIGLIADGDIDAATGNFVALIELQSIEASPLVGKWGLQSLYHGSIGYTWYAEGGYATFNNDGTGFGICRFNDDGLLGNCTDYNFTWSTTLNPDGTIFLITITNPENETWTDKLALSDDGKMMILDGTEDTTQQSLEIFVRLDSDKSYTNADFSGERYYSRYMHDMAGRHTACSGISMPDGAGNFTASSTCNQDGVVSSNSGSGHYSVNPDGSFTFIENNISGYLSGDGVCLVNGHVDTPAVWSIAMNLKKQDRTYCTADLAGTWVVSGFGDDNGNSFNAEFGTMTCDVSGNCTFAFKNQRDGNITYESATVSLPVSGDGSFGTSLGDMSPYYAGAIGNNGNTIIFNQSFDSTGVQGLNHREIFVGVKCSSCCNVGFLKTWFEEDDCSITNTGIWSPYTCASCSSGSLKYSNQTGARAEFSFNGTGIKWIVAKGPMMGKAKVYLDGVYMGLIDLYSPSMKYNQILPKTGLAPGSHTVAIEVSGKKNAGATGTVINVDAFEVVP